MAGLSEDQFLDQLENLKGKVALVTGGGNGIGLDTTRYLAQKGCTVIVASRNQQKCEAAIEALYIRDPRTYEPRQISFQKLDLGSMASARAGADEFLKTHQKLDILVLNAGLMALPRAKLGPDGYEQTFNTNHLGHFALTMALLPTLRRTADEKGGPGESRIVVVSSYGYTFCRHNLDYKELTTTHPGEGVGMATFTQKFARYCDSKLANVLFAMELARRLREAEIKNIFVNACHPGTSLGTGLGDGLLLPLWMEKLMRKFLARVANTCEDSAKTQVWLAASRTVKNDDIHGEMWYPNWSWLGYWRGCYEAKLTKLGGDMGEWGELWNLSAKAYEKATGKGSDVGAKN